MAAYGGYYDDYYDPNNPYGPYGARDTGIPPVDPPAGRDTTSGTPPGTPPTNPTPPAETPPADPWDTAPTDGNWQMWFLKNVGSLPANGQTLAGLEGKLGKHGIKVLRNSAGVAGKIQLPNGQIVDVGRAFSSGNPGAMGWQWDASTGGGHNGPIDLSGAGIDPSYLAPWTGPAPGRGSTPSFEEPGAFNAPDAAALFADPSYQFRMDQGRGALENSAAARGTLNSGGTLKDILDYGQKAASQEYSNVWDRSFGVWNANWNNALTKFRTAKDVDDTSYNRAWQGYLDAKDTWYRNQDAPFSKLIQAAGLGASSSR